MTMVEGATPKPGGEPQGDPDQLRVHQGPREFANLVVERKPSGEIIFDPHVTGMCMIIFSEDSARALFDVLKTWLGSAAPR